MTLRFKSIGSGSAGNGTLVQASSGGHTTTLLVDCGFGLRHVKHRLAQAGLAATDLSGIFVTHEHGDHVGCTVALALQDQIPVFMSTGTYQAIGEPALGSLLHITHDHATIELGLLELHPFTVPHDAWEPLQLMVSDGQRRLGLLTDLGHPTPHVIDALKSCDGLLLECNHDTEMLAQSKYPMSLKRRIAGRLGHLDNHAAHHIAQAVNHAGLKVLVAAHLSERNNLPELAAQSLADAVNGQAQDIVVAHPETGTPWLGLV